MGRRAASWKRTVASALASWPGIVAAVAASNGGLVVGVRRLAVALFVAMLRLRKTVLSRTQGIVLGSVTSYAGKHFAQYVELLRWRRRVFYHRVHVVLLSWDPVADASFRIEKRTLLEGSLEDSILNGNHAAAKLCSGAAARCSAARPFVTQHLPSEERYQLLNNALNLISSLTPAGHIAEDIYPASTVGCWYVFGLTVDKYASPDRPETPDSKIRLTLVKEQVLLWICDPRHTAAVEFADQVFRSAASKRHLSRWRCLRSMADMYRKQEEWALDKRGGRVMHILRVHLSVPMSLESAPQTPSDTQSNATPRLSTTRRKSLQAAFQAQASSRQEHAEDASSEALGKRKKLLRKNSSSPLSTSPLPNPRTPTMVAAAAATSSSGISCTSPVMFSPWATSGPHTSSRSLQRASSAPSSEPFLDGSEGVLCTDDDAQDRSSLSSLNLGNIGNYIPDF